MSAEAPEQDPAEKVFENVIGVLRDSNCPSWPLSQRRRLSSLLSEFLNKVGAAPKTAQAEDNDDDADGEEGLPEKRQRQEDASAAPPAAAPVAEEYSDQVMMTRRIRTHHQLTKVKKHLLEVAPHGSIPEKIFMPQNSVGFAGDVPTFEIDAFLYDNEGIDKLCDEGVVSRNYCTECKGVEFADTQLISHSFSVEQLQYIFTELFPRHVEPLFADGIKKLVDVGSRFGVVLAAAFSSTSIPELVGVEISQQYCRVQQQLVGKFHMDRRARILCADILSDKGIEELVSADVVFLHNVFEWFAPDEGQLPIWQKLGKTLRKGQVLVVSPSLEISLKGADPENDPTEFVSKWVRRVDISEAQTAYSNWVSNRDNGEDSDEELEEVSEDVDLANVIQVYVVENPMQ